MFWFLPVLFLLFIVPQAVFSTFWYGDYLAFLVLSSALLAVASYIFGAGVAYKVSKVRVLDLRRGRRILFVTITFLFIASYGALYFSYQGAPIVDVVFMGRDSATARSEFYKDVGGVWSVFSYSRSMLTRGFVPFAILLAYLYVGKIKFYVLLVIISILSISSLEKSLLVWAYAPLLFYTFFSGRKKDFFRIIMIGVGFFVLVSLVSLGGTRGETVAEDSIQIPHHAEWGYSYAACFNECGEFSQSISLSDQPNYQFMLYDLKSSGRGEYLVNRFIWIPFVTAYDTIYFWSLNYDSHIGLAVNRHFSKILGYDFADLERRVFRFQFGSGEDSTGNANAAYIAEAYIAFGYLGVVVFSLLIGIGAGWVVKAGVPCFLFALPVLGFGLINASFISMLYSGGILVFFLCFVGFTTSKGYRWRA